MKPETMTSPAAAPFICKPHRWSGQGQCPECKEIDELFNYPKSAPRQSDPSMVICPGCVHEFRAIPEDVQAELAALRRALAEAEARVRELEHESSAHARACTKAVEALVATEQHCRLYHCEASALAAAEADKRRIAEAERLIAHAVELMTPEQVGQWTGVRYWQENIDAAISADEREGEK